MTDKIHKMIDYIIDCLGRERGRERARRGGEEERDGGRVGKLKKDTMDIRLSRRVNLLHFGTSTRARRSPWDPTKHKPRRSEIEYLR